MRDEADPDVPARGADVTNSQGVQVGDHTVQINFLFGGSRASGPVVAGNVPQAPPAFQPREDLMARLRAAGSGVSVVHAVTGMRGVGKTQLAAAYARECMEAGWRLVAWVNAEDAATALNDFAVVANRLGINRPGSDLKAIAQEVRNRLETDGDKSLIVFDNVTDFAAIQPYVPARRRPQVLVTTTEARLPVDCKPLPVDVFTEVEALAFLAERAGRDEPTEGKALASELGYLPLALAQAAAVIATQRLSYRDYLDRLRTHPAEEQLRPAKDDPYPRGVADAILLSIDAVTTTDPTGLSGALLGIVSLLSAEGVSRDLLHYAGTEGLLPGDQRKGMRHRLRGGKRKVPAAATDEALGRLAAASLLAFSTDGTRVLAHRLVMRVLRDRAARQGVLGNHGAQAMRLLNTYPVGEPWKNRTKARDCVRQVVSLADHFAEFPGETPPKGLLALRGWALWCLNELGDSAAQAVALGEPLVSDRARLLGETHSDTRKSRGNLALAYKAAGHLDKAISLYERTLKDDAQELGEGHPDTLRSRNNLAVAYQAAGRLEEAISLFEQTLADRERVLGEAHQDTLVSRNSLATGYDDADRLDEAIPLYERTLEDYARILGEGHQDTLMVRSNLADSYVRAGRVDESICLLERTVADFGQVLGDAHPRTLRSRGSLAWAYKVADRLDDAIPLLERTVTDYRRVFGDTHPDTLKWQNNLAGMYLDTGRIDDAVPIYEQALAALEEVLGAEHPETAVVRRNLESARARAGNAEGGAPD